MPFLLLLQGQAAGRQSETAGRPMVEGYLHKENSACTVQPPTPATNAVTRLQHAFTKGAGQKNWEDSQLH